MRPSAQSGIGTMRSGQLCSSSSHIYLNRDLLLLMALLDQVKTEEKPSMISWTLPPNCQLCNKGEEGLVVCSRGLYGIMKYLLTIYRHLWYMLGGRHLASKNNVGLVLALDIQIESSIINVCKPQMVTLLTPSPPPYFHSEAQVR